MKEAVANRVSFDKIIAEIKKYKVITAPTVSVIASGRKVDRRQSKV